jgi:hypothetical protein
MSEIKNITNIFNFKKPETTIKKKCTHYKNNWLLSSRIPEYFIYIKF